MPKIPNLSIRSMSHQDLDFAAQCTANEGWISEDYPALERMYQHDPDGCLLAEVDGRPAGICFATPYEDSGFIGELIVQPQVRGQGLGGALLDYAVAYLRARGAHTVYLDGVVKATPLYERHGFRKICRSLRLRGELSGETHPQIRPMQASDLPAVYALDHQAFGADRSFFLAGRLERYPQLSKVMLHENTLLGYISGRGGQGWASAGPWVSAQGAPDPLPLLEAFAAEVGIPFSVGVLASNHLVADRLRALDFQQRADSPWRMALGPAEDLGANPQSLAVGSAAKG